MIYFHEIKLTFEDHVCIVAVCMSVDYGSVESFSSCVGGEEFMRLVSVRYCIYCIGACYGVPSSNFFLKKIDPIMRSSSGYIHHWGVHPTSTTPGVLWAYVD